MSAGDIMLGDGVFGIVTSSGATAIEFLCRGGGNLHVDKEFRLIAADGDYGPVTGRVRLIKVVPTLTVNLLELIAGNYPHLFPPSSMTTTNSTQWRPILSLTSSAHVYGAVFTGSLRDGRSATITVSNALNMEPIDLPLTDKDEVVAKLVFTGFYTSSDRTTVPLTIVYSTA
jgi:hypothetical protein